MQAFNFFLFACLSIISFYFRWQTKWCVGWPFRLLNWCPRIWAWKSCINRLAGCSMKPALRRQHLSDCRRALYSNFEQSKTLTQSPAIHGASIWHASSLCWQEKPTLQLLLYSRHSIRWMTWKLTIFYGWQSEYRNLCKDAPTCAPLWNSPNIKATKENRQWSRMMANQVRRSLKTHCQTAD